MHHVIAQQDLRRLTRDRVELRGLLTDPRNLLGLCVTCHDRHTLAFARLSFSLLSQDALDFAHEIGLSHLLDRYYTKDDYGCAA